MFYRVGMAIAAGLAELGVRPASALAGDSAGHAGSGALPVLSSLQELLPGGLRRGATVAVTARGEGATSLLLALLAEPSRTGAWCAVTGMPALSLATALSMGIVLERLALVPRPGPDTAAVAATLLDGFDIVVVAAPGLAPGVCAQLSARARQGKATLVTMTPWAGASLTLTAEGGTWFGHRRLRCRRLTVTVGGRGGAARPRRGEVWLPADPDFQDTLAAGGRQDHRHLRAVR
ncbi:MAG: hypothetical protein V7603_5099 [Micromonosporaceae bacterium]